MFWGEIASSCEHMALFKYLKRETATLLDKQTWDTTAKFKKFLQHFFNGQFRAKLTNLKTANIPSFMVYIPPNIVFSLYSKCVILTCCVLQYFDYLSTLCTCLNLQKAFFDERWILFLIICNVWTGLFVWLVSWSE